MLYSVYNWDTKSYDYYEGPESKRRSMNSNDLGASPDDVAVALPNGATKIGSGEDAKGVVATDKPGAGSTTWLMIGLGIGALWLFLPGMFKRWM